MYKIKKNNSSRKKKKKDVTKKFSTTFSHENCEMKKIINYPSLWSIMYKYPRTKSSNSEKCNKRDTDLLLKQLSSVIVF